MNTRLLTVAVLVIGAACGAPSATNDSSMDCGVAASLQAAPDAGAPYVPPPRLEVRPDPQTNRRVVWDVDAQAVCERQPLCIECVLPWSDNPHYCVPIGSWDGRPTGLTPFALGAWYADPLCQVRLYGLPVGRSEGANPRWAYEFIEVSKRARLFGIEPLPTFPVRPHKRDLYDLRSVCEPVAPADLAAAQRNVKPYVQTREHSPEEWAPWSEAQRLLDGAK